MDPIFRRSRNPITGDNVRFANVENDDFEDDESEFGIESKTAECSTPKVKLKIYLQEIHLVVSCRFFPFNSVQVNRCDVEDSPTTDIHIPPSLPEEGFVKGDYCVDYGINYQDGDQFRNIKGRYISPTFSE